MTAKRKATLIVFTTRMAELAAWYQQVLALPAPEAQGDRHLGFDLESLYLGFDAVDTERGHGAVVLWLPVDDLDATFARCVERGARVGFAPVDKPWGDRIAQVFDPDGNPLGLSQARGQTAST